MSVRELHNSLVSDTNYDGLKDDRYEDDNIIISDSTLGSLLTPQLKKMSALYNIICGCECCISAKSIHSSLLSWRDGYLNQLKYQTQNSQSRRSSERLHHIYETLKNTVIPHGRHIYAKAYDTEKATMCTYPQYDHALPQRKYVLPCSAKCPCINIPDQEIDKNYE